MTYTLIAYIAYTYGFEQSRLPANYTTEKCWW